MICVPKNDLRTGFLQIPMMNRLDGALRADRHERRRLDNAVWGPDFPDARLAVGASHREAER